MGQNIQSYETVDPNTPASGFGSIYPKTDGHLYWKNAAGTVIRLDGTLIAGANITLTANGDGTYTIASTGGGGGGGANTADHFIVGQNGQNDTDLTNKVIIPGLSGSPDIRVAGVNDDEFDTVLSGWTNLNSPNIVNSNTDAISHLHLKANANATSALKGIYKSVPAIPFTVTAKISDCYIRGSFNRAGIMIMPSASTSAVVIAFGTTDSNASSSGTGVEYLAYSSLSASSGITVLTGGQTAGYLRLVVNSSTSVDAYFSINGFVWRLVSNTNPGFTVANVGLCVDSGNSTYPGEAYFDWIRFS